MFKQLLCSTVALMASQAALADTWQLNSENAELYFASVKNDTVEETHRFTSITGTLEDGALSISIPLSSIDTTIPIRNERMLEHLFDASKHPAVTATATLPEALYDTSNAPSTQVATVPLALTIAGETITVEAAVQVTHLNETTLLATTRQPILVNAKAFDLVAGIDKLREIAGLNAIDYVVPVTFSVQFEKED
ncbi:YceI family protein [Pseudidiomarina sediminum]|uniref:YceI family protein n=1 Tax=Pseudidiomarina sediminum TaxID=431675 RepID=A0A432Z441_9GAMM|nr:YceI family protein [Pseudidiomarina sediminum]MBY6062876.1 YceI family protein [Pseudidiomarina sediminum]RUO72678.1 YceI family protein [Pseudidiomarina sediminum]